MTARVLRTGERATCRFTFMYRPEYIKPGARLLFREGRTKGVGKLLSVEEDGLGPQPTIEVRIQPCPALVVTLSCRHSQADCLVVIRLVLTLLSCDILLSAFELDRNTPCTLVVTLSCRHSS